MTILIQYCTHARSQCTLSLRVRKKLSFVYGTSCLYSPVVLQTALRFCVVMENILKFPLTIGLKARNRQECNCMVFHQYNICNLFCYYAKRLLFLFQIFRIVTKHSKTQLWHFQNLKTAIQKTYSQDSFRGLSQCYVARCTSRIAAV